VLTGHPEVLTPVVFVESLFMKMPLRQDWFTQLAARSVAPSFPTVPSDGSISGHGFRADAAQSRFRAGSLFSGAQTMWSPEAREFTHNNTR